MYVFIVIQLLLLLNNLTVRVFRPSQLYNDIFQAFGEKKCFY